MIFLDIKSSTGLAKLGVILVLGVVALFFLGLASVSYVEGESSYNKNLILENKEVVDGICGPETWQIINDNRQATLEYNDFASKFEYKLTAQGLANEDYVLIYYADEDPRFQNWGGNPALLLGTLNAGETVLESSVDTGDLPFDTDWNIDPDPDYCDCHNNHDDYEHCSGAKIWLVPSSDYDEQEQTIYPNWNPESYLFETDLITYVVECHYDSDLGECVGVCENPDMICYEIDSQYCECVECEPGDTQPCGELPACEGIQTCQQDGTWGHCDSEGEFCGILECPDSCLIDGLFPPQSYTWDYALSEAKYCDYYGICNDAQCSYEHYCSDDDYNDGYPPIGVYDSCHAPCDQPGEHDCPSECDGDILLQSNGCDWQGSCECYEKTPLDCNQYDCSTGLECEFVNSDTIKETGDDYTCDGGELVDCDPLGTKDCYGPWVCDETNECNSQACGDNTYTCYQENPWMWGTPPEIETDCSDGYDNDCDGDVDCEDSDCVGEEGPGGVICCYDDSNCPTDVCTDTGDEYGGGSCSATDNYCNLETYTCEYSTSDGTDTCSGDDSPTATYYYCSDEDENNDGDDTCISDTTTEYDSCSKVETSCSASDWYCNGNVLTSTSTEGIDDCSNSIIDPYYLCTANDGSVDDTCTPDIFDCNIYDDDFWVFDVCDPTIGDIFGWYEDWTCEQGTCAYSGYDWQDGLVEDCVDECSDTDNGIEFLIQGTVTDDDECSDAEEGCPSADYTDSCIDEDTLEEYYCNINNDVAWMNKDCNDYDCSTPDPNICEGVGTDTIKELGDDYSCSVGACATTATMTCDGPWVCDGNTECYYEDCGDSSYQCYRANPNGGWIWGTPLTTETNCADGYDNDCDGLIDCADPDCDETPPETTKEYGIPFYSDEMHDWINSLTPITLIAEDLPGVEEQCASGVDETYYRYCLKPGCYEDEPCDCEGETWEVYEGAFNIPEDLGHCIEYYSTDLLGNQEEPNSQCVFVDDTPPTRNKIVGFPQAPGDGETFDFWVSQNTDITLECIDQEPHPVNHEEACFKISFDEPEWHYITEEYCPVELDPEGWCCINVEEDNTYTFTFNEDSMHDLEFFCRDVLGNANEVDLEYFRVDTTPPEIIKTVGDPKYPCDEGDQCEWYITSDTSITLETIDGGEICAIDDVTCMWGYWFNDEWYGWYEYGEDIYFEEDSFHELHYYCYDALGNSNGDEEEPHVQYYSVDNMPPESNITEPHQQYAPGTEEGKIEVCWDGYDEEKSGIDYFDIQYKEEGGEWQDWLNETDNECELFPYGEYDHTYCFRSIATDNLGNKEVKEGEDICSMIVEYKFRIFLNLAEDPNNWNLISIPVALINDSIEEILKDIKDNITSVWTYDPTIPDPMDQWLVYTPDGDNTNDDLHTMTPGWGYWVHVKNDTWLEIGGSLMRPPPFNMPSKNLESGWNLIGYYGTDEWDEYTGPAGNGDIAYCALFSLVDTMIGFPRWSSLWGYWNENPPGFFPIGFEDKLDPGAGYWIEMDVEEIYAPASDCWGFW